MTNNQQLKVHCEDVIANPQDHLDWVVDMARVALVSLEAEPVAYITYKGYLIHAGDPKLAEYSEPSPLYDAPAAPEHNKKPSEEG